MLCYVKRCKNLDVFSTYFYSLTIQTLFWAIFGLIDLKNFELTNIRNLQSFSVPHWSLCVIAGAYFIGVTYQLVTYTIWSKTS